MSRRRSGDTIEPGAGPERQPEGFETDSAFDIAQDLLQAALEEVRVSPPDPEPSPAADEAGPAVRTRRTGRRRAGSGGSLQPELSPTPTTAATTEPAPLHRGPGRSRRRSRRPTTEHQVPAERASDVAVLASIGALEEEADRIRRGTGAVATDVGGSLSIDALEEETDRTRRRSRVAASNDDATIPEVAVVAPTSSPTPERPRARPTRARPAPATATRVSHRRTWVALVVVLAVVVIGVATVVAVSVGGGSDEPAPSAARAVPEQARLKFDPVTTAEGVTVGRVWTLQGKQGSRFVGRLSFSNPTSAPLVATYTEVIPKSLASSVDDITFEPEPTVLEADPVVQYSLTVPAGGTVTARYAIEVAPDGTARGRLQGWAGDAEDATQARAATTTTTTTAPPTTTTAPPPTTPPPTAAALPPPPPPPQATGAIVVRTVSQGTKGTFSYSGPGGSASLTTSGSQSSAQSAPIPVPAGTHSWTQVSAPPGSGLVGVGCSDGESGGSGATATFIVQSGETVVCTWTNG